VVTLTIFSTVVPIFTGHRVKVYWRKKRDARAAAPAANLLADTCGLPTLSVSPIMAPISDADSLPAHPPSARPRTLNPTFMFDHTSSV